MALSCFFFHYLFVVEQNLVVVVDLDLVSQVLSVVTANVTLLVPRPRP